MGFAVKRKLKTKDMKREVKVGIFAVLMLVLGWGVVRYLKGASIFSTSNTYYAYYAQAGGIQPASHVMINGVKVGVVDDVVLNEDPTKGVEVTMSIEKRFQIPVDSKARIFTDGLMGGKAIEIVYGKASGVIVDGGTIEAEAAADLFEMAGSELGDLKTKLTTVMDGLATTLEGVNKLLAENTETLTSIIDNVDGVTGNVDAMLAKEKAHLEEALASLSLFSKSLGDNAGQVDQIIDNLATFSDQLSGGNLIAEVERVVGELNGVLAAVNDQSGSVGKLLKDAELYDNLASASNNLSALLEDLKANPGRYLNVSVFGKDPYKKVEKAKAKAEKKAIKREMEAAEKAAEQADK